MKSLLEEIQKELRQKKKINWFLLLIYRNRLIKNMIKDRKEIQENQLKISKVMGLKTQLRV